MLCYVAVCYVKGHLSVVVPASMYFLIMFRLLTMLYSGYCMHYLFRRLIGEVLSSEMLSYSDGLRQ